MHTSPAVTHLRRDAPAPSRRGLLGKLLVAGAGIGLGVCRDAAAARKRRKKQRRKPVAPPTCAQLCPAACGYCYLRPSGPVQCGGEADADCEVACSSDNDCLGTGRPFCTHRFIDRASGETLSWNCPGDPDGLCTDIGACGT